MSKRIKGITIELNGETKGLDKALGKVNQRSNKLQGELKDVERLLKFDPGNTELLAQKQKILTEQVGATRDKLDQLKAAQQQVNQAFEAGDVSEAQYRAFQRELTETENRLKSFEQQLKSSQQESDGLEKALGDVNQRSKGLQQELRDVERLLKFNPGNAELLAQKQKILSEQVATTGDKLERLKAKQQEVNRAFASGEIGEDQYRAFQREVVETESSLKNFERKLDATNQAIRESGQGVKDSARDWAAAGDKIGNAGEKMKGAGAAMSQGVTGPIAGLGAAALKSASDFDASQGNIQSSLGVTAEEAERLNDVAQSVWREGFGESLKGVTDDLSLIRQNMGEMSDQELKQMLEGVTMLRDKGWAEVNESTRTASVLMKNFNIDSQTALDLMTTGFQRGGNFSDELLDTMREYAPQFKGMGFTAEEFTAILIAGAEAGAFSLDKIGDAAKESFVKIGDGTKGTRDALGGLGLDVNQIENDINAGGESANAAFTAVASAIAGVESPADRAQAAIALFGAPMEDLGPEFQTFFANVNTDLGNFEGATQRASDSMRDNFGTRLSSVFRELQVALLPLGMVLLDMAEAILPKLEAIIKRVADWFTNLSPAGQQFTVILGMVAAAIGPVLYVLGSFVGVIGNLIPVFVKLFGYLKNIQTVFTIIRTVMLALTGPVVIVIAIITLLAVAIYQNWDAIKAKTMQVFDYLKTKIPEVWRAIKEWVSQVVVSMVTYVVGRFQGFKLAVLTVFNYLRAKIPEIWTALKERITQIVLAVVTYVVGRFNAFKQTVTAIFSGVKTGVLNVFGALKDGLIQRATSIWERIRSTFSKVREAITGPIEKARDVVLRIIDVIKSAFEKMNIKIPNPKLPKIDVSMGSKSIGGVDIPFPKFDVKWFKKGGVFGSASVIGVGEEPGVSEAVVPLKPSVLAQIGKGIADNMPSVAGGASEVSVYLDGYLIAKAMQPHMDRGMQARTEAKSYMKGVR